MKSLLSRFAILPICTLLIITSCSSSNNECTFEPNLTVNQTQLAADIAAIDAFLAENNITAQIDPSGLRFVITEEGDGANADFCSDVSVTFVGTLLNGQIFDASDRPTTFNLRELIVGWQIGIPLVRSGGSITLYIPSVYAFGASPVPGIPVNSSLIFEIDVIGVD